MDFPSDFYITDNKGLALVIKLISKAKIVAMDTEFTREKTYYPILSLVQIAVKDGNKQKLFVIDCLCDIDLKPLHKIINNKKITKIFHSCMQDLQIFYQQSNKLAVSIADTQIMSNFSDVGFNIGYSGLVEHFFGKKIDKSQQRSNWQKRPLTEKQIEYALSDVLYLEEIHDKLLEILEEKKRKKWYLEEVKSFVENDIIKPDENLFKNLNFRKKTPNQIVKIQKLVVWREAKVKELDIPRQYLLKDEMIDNIVTYNELNVRLSANKAKEVRAIMDHKESAKEIKTAMKFANKNPFMSGKQKKVYEEAKIIISEVAFEEKLKEQLLITGSELKDLIHGNRSIKNLLRGWRFDILGKKLKQLEVLK